MAKGGGTEGIDKAEVKKLLIQSKREPVSCAVGLGPDQQALIMLHKVKQPRALAKELEKNYGEIKNPRWGTAFVDIDDDPKLVIVTLNKPSSGLARKLKKALTGTGFSKLRIALEDGSVAEAVEEEDEDEEGAELSGDGAATPDDAAAETVSTAPGGVVASAPDDSGGEPIDPAQLTARLTDLVKQMMGVIAKNPTQKSALAELAMNAQASLKRGDLDSAAEGVEILRQAIDSAQAGSSSDDPASAADPGDPTEAQGETPVAPKFTAAGKAHAKARVAWLATRAKVSSQLDGLSNEFESAFKDHGKAADLQQAFKQRIDGVLNDLDEELANKLDEVNEAPDAAAHAKIVEEARQIISRYQSFVTSDPTIAALDKNPFVPLDLQKTLTATLGTLSKVL